MNIVYVNHKPYEVDTATKVYGSYPKLIQWFNDHEGYHRIDGPARVFDGLTDEWHIHGYNITGEVNAWMKENDITWPFNEESLVLFKLRFIDYA